MPSCARTRQAAGRAAAGSGIHCRTRAGPSATGRHLGTDYHIFEGKHPFLQYPRIMGHELAVEVVEAPVELGLSVGEVCVVNPYRSCGRCIACVAGKPNCCVNISVLGVHQDGGLAGLLSVPQGNLIRAQGLKLDECAIVEFLAIGAHAVRRGAVTSRDRVLVVGAGPIGLGVALSACASGAEVPALDRDTERTAAAEKLAGATAIKVESDASEAVSAFTDGVGFDIVFDATGSQAAMERGFESSLMAAVTCWELIKETITFMDRIFTATKTTTLWKPKRDH